MGKQVGGHTDKRSRPRNSDNSWYDWNKIKNDYIRNPDLSTTKLAEKYGIRYTTVKDRCRKEGWYQEKIKWQEDVRKRASERFAEKAARALEGELETADAVAKLISLLLKDEKQFNRHIIQKTRDGESWAEEEIYKKADARALKEVVQSLTMAADIKRTILGIQRVDQLQKAEFERQRLEIEQERLALEKERLAMLKSKEAVDLSEYGVVLMPDIKKASDAGAVDAGALVTDGVTGDEDPVTASVTEAQPDAAELGEPGSLAGLCGALSASESEV